MSNIDWIDIPNEDFSIVLGYETVYTETLTQLVHDYHNLPKDQIAPLSTRIEKLDTIISFIDDWTNNKLQPKDKPKHLLWISEICSKKRNYLSELLDIYKNNRHLDESQTNYHQNINALVDKSRKVVFLTNHRYFSLKMREYWGDFWYETLDPCHRRLTPFLDQWRALKNSQPFIPHFFLWLETQNIPKYVPRVKYLNNDELEKQRVVIKDGLFWEKTDGEWVLADYNEINKRYLFSINLKEEIYIAEEGLGVSHSSFTCGQPVLGAGLISINKGQCISLALESGHYMPTLEIGYQIVQIFLSKGAFFSNGLEIIFFYDRNKYKANLSSDQLISFEKFKAVLESACQQEKICHAQPH